MLKRDGPAVLLPGFTLGRQTAAIPQEIESAGQEKHVAREQGYSHEAFSLPVYRYHALGCSRNNSARGARTNSCRHTMCRLITQALEFSTGLAHERLRQELQQVAPCGE
jgi:hypothetical protein